MRLPPQVLVDLISAIGETEAFQQLRTQQQLGYYVGIHASVLTGVPGLLLEVDSYGKKFTVETVLERVEAFLGGHFAQELDTMDEALYKKHLQALIMIKLRLDDNMQEQADRYWNHMQSQLRGMGLKEEREF